MLIRRIRPRLRRLVLLLAWMIIESEAVLEAWLRAFVEMISAGIRSVHVVLEQRAVVAVGVVREMLVKGRCLAGLHTVQAGVSAAIEGIG